MEDNLEAMEAIAVLPYFKQVVDDEYGEQGWTPILAAASQPATTEHKCIKFLTEYGANLFHKSRAHGNTVLHIAAGNNQIQLLDYCLMRLSPQERRNMINAKNNDGLTPGHFAAGLENFDALSLLLENGADPTIESQPCNNVFSELIVNDHADLLGCVWHLTKLVKRDLNEVS